MFDVTQAVKGHDITGGTCFQLALNQNFVTFITETEGYEKTLSLVMLYRSHCFGVVD